MTDWKQITARIRRARTSKDPAGQLSNLFEKTRDAMVAFELAKYFETSGQNADSLNCNVTPPNRFPGAVGRPKDKEPITGLAGTWPEKPSPLPPASTNRKTPFPVPIFPP